MLRFIENPLRGREHEVMQHLVNEVKPKSTIQIYDLYLIHRSRITSVHLNSFNLVCLPPYGRRHPSDLNCACFIHLRCISLLVLSSWNKLWMQLCHFFAISVICHIIWNRNGGLTLAQGLASLSIILLMNSTIALMLRP